MEENLKTDNDACPFCGYRGELIWVHGHGQCKNCTKNIEPCCEGRPLDCENS